MTTAVEYDEILCDVEIDCWGAGHGYSFQEYARRRGDFAIVGVAALLERAADGAISRAAVSVCGVATEPVRLRNLEEQLVGLTLDDDEIEELSEQAGEIEALEDHHASAQYRQHLAQVLTARALHEARQRLGVAQ